MPFTAAQIAERFPDYPPRHVRIFTEAYNAAELALGDNHDDAIAHRIATAAAQRLNEDNRTTSLTLAEILDVFDRVVITGGPRTGKTTLSDAITDRPVIHTDEYNDLEWASVPIAILAEMEDKGDRWLLEGVHGARTLRKGLEADAVVVLTQPRVDRKPGQDRMAKAIETILADWLQQTGDSVPVFYIVPPESRGAQAAADNQLPDFRTLCGPVVLLADGEPDDENLIEGAPIQVAKAGDFSETRGFKLSNDDLEAFVRNSSPDRFGRQVHFDYDHGSEMPADDPKKAGVAAGWLKELFRKGSELWAVPRWTQDAFDAITSGEWKYISPAFHLEYMKDDGTRLGPTITSIALTNTPFLKGMEPITANELLINLTTHGEEEEVATMDKELRELLGLAETATDEQVTAAINALQEDGGTDGTAILRAVLSSAGISDEQVAELLPEDGEPDAAAISAALTEVAETKAQQLSDKQGEGKHVLTDEQFQELKAGADKAEKIEAELTSSKAAAAVQALRGDYKITTKKLAEWAEQYFVDNGEEAFNAWAETLSVDERAKALAGESGHSLGSEEDDGDDVDKVVETRINELMKEGLNYRDAYIKCFSEDKGLEKRYADKHTTPV